MGTDDPMQVDTEGAAAGEPLLDEDNLQSEVIVHPLVLLSVVDHYNRVAKDTRKRVVGVLLGSEWKGKVDVTNSFAVPFEEDLRNPGVWYLDHNYLESMRDMFKKINVKEKIVGFYSTGPKIKPADLEIDELFRRYCRRPAFVIIDVRPEVEEIPTSAYGTVEELTEGKEIRRSFKHIASSVGAFEAEEVGVEQLLRDINDPSVSTLANRVKQKVVGLAGLSDRLVEMRTYLQNVLDGKMPVNHQITYHIQTIFNLLPNLNVESLVRSMIVKTNDMSLVVYMATIIRCIISLQNLVNNKFALSEGTATTDARDEAKDAETAKAAEEAKQAKERQDIIDAAKKRNAKKEEEKKGKK